MAVVENQMLFTVFLSRIRTTLPAIALGVITLSGIQAAPQQAKDPAIASPAPGIPKKEMDSGHSTAGGDIPKTFAAPLDEYDYIRREVMIPMRDGIKLHTVIMVPKGAKDAPILLTRTPY